MRTVIVGAGGFVGGSLQRYLAGKGELVALRRAQLDLLEPDSIRAQLRAGDVVVNAAGYANATDTTAEGVARFRAANVQGVENLAAVAAEVEVKQLIHLSSVAAMGRWQQHGVDEGMMRPTENPYALSKRGGEEALLAWRERLPVTVLRPTSVFGEGRGLAATLCRAVSGGIVPLPGGGRAEIPFTYIGNVAKGLELCVDNPNCFGKTFIVGDVRSYTLREVVEALALALGVEARIVSVPTPLAQAGVWGLEALGRVRRAPPILDRWRLQTLSRSVSYSVAKLQAATGYTPPYSLAAATACIAAWYRQTMRAP